MRVLVTGASGLLGANLIRELLGGGHRVRALVRSTSDTRGIDSLEVERVVGDVRDKIAVREAVDGCDVVFHAAAVFAYWGYSRDEMMDTVREGTGIVVEAVRDAKVPRMVLTSSTAIFGGNDSPESLDENSPAVEDRGPDYFQSKALQERIAVEMARELGVELIVVNPSLFVGPHDYKPSTSSQTLTGFLRDPLKMTYPGGVCLAHVADVARGHLIALEQGTPGERHIVGGENIEFRTLHDMLAVMTDGPGPRITMNRTLAVGGAALMELASMVTRRPPAATRALAGQVGRYFWYSSAKMRRMGYEHRTAKQTVRETLSWWIKSPHVNARERTAWAPRL